MFRKPLKDLNEIPELESALTELDDDESDIREEMRKLDKESAEEKNELLLEELFNKRGMYLQQLDKIESRRRAIREKIATLKQEKYGKKQNEDGTEIMEVQERISDLRERIEALQLKIQSGNLGPTDQLTLKLYEEEMAKLRNRERELDPQGQHNSPQSHTKRDEQSEDIRIDDK